MLTAVTANRIVNVSIRRREMNVRPHSAKTPQRQRAAISKRQMDAASATALAEMASAHNKKSLTLFVGAGVSAGLGRPTWYNFLCSCAAKIRCLTAVRRMLKRSEYEQAAQHVIDKDPNQFEAEFRRAFGVIPDERIPADSLPAILATRFAGTVVSTNFDNVLESSFEQVGNAFSGDHIFRGLQHPSDIAAVLNRDKRLLVKLHGDATGEGRVLTAAEYLRAYGSAEKYQATSLSRALREIFTRERLLFVGCSLVQDRYLRLMQSVAKEKGGQHRHFAIVEKRKGFAADAERMSGCSITPIWFKPGQYARIAEIILGLPDNRPTSIPERRSATIRSNLTPEGVVRLKEMLSNAISAGCQAVDGILHSDVDVVHRPELWPENATVTIGKIGNQMFVEFYPAAQLISSSEHCRRYEFPANIVESPSPTFTYGPRGHGLAPAFSVQVRWISQSSEIAVNVTSTRPSAHNEPIVTVLFHFTTGAVS